MTGSLGANPLARFVIALLALLLPLGGVAAQEQDPPPPERSAPEQGQPEQGQPEQGQPEQGQPKPAPEAQEPESQAPKPEAPAGAPPQNPGFEEGALGEAPAGWFFTSSCEGTAKVVADDAFADSRCVVVDATADVEAERRFTNLMQSVPADGWVGKRLRYRAAVRVESLDPGSTVQLWFRVDRPKDADGRSQTGAFDNMGDRPIRADGWRHYDIVLDVADDAERLVVGAFVLGSGRVRIDDVSLVEVGKDTATTGGASSARSGRSGMNPLVRQALAEAEDAPQQPFWTWWLLLPAAALALFVIGMWPSWGRAAAPAATYHDDDVPPPSPTVGFLRTFAFVFAVLYWLLYCLPQPFTSLVSGIDQAVAWLVDDNPQGWAGPLMREHVAFEKWLSTTVAEYGFGIEGELVPPNGSGDTTQAYMTILGFFVLAFVAAMVATALLRRLRVRLHAIGTDLLRSYLRYVLAATMLGYGLAKLRMTGNQFSELGEYQLNATWGDSSPMGVVWKFMGASRPYTIFGGLGEVVGALLLIWRRTALLGGIVTVAVMTNVVMLNYCYDVPVKQYSTHLLVMGVLVLVPELPRLARLFVWNRPAEAFTQPTLWDNKFLWWLGLIGKLVVLFTCFGMPIYTWQNGLREDLAKQADAAPSGEPKHRLTRRGYRWINEVPFNR